MIEPPVQSGRTPIDVEKEQQGEVDNPTPKNEATTNSKETRSELKARLKKLVAKGTPDAIDEALKIMGDREKELLDRGKFFSDLFWDVDDPRIAPVAQKVAEEEIALGLGDQSELQGYLELIALKGGRQGAEWVLSLIAREGDTNSLSRAAASAARCIRDKSLVNQLLELVKSAESNGVRYRLVKGLAAWKTTEISNHLVEVAYSPDVPIETRLDCFWSLGAYAKNPTEVARIIEPFRKGDLFNQRLALAAVEGLATNDHPEFLNYDVFDVLKQSLQSSRVDLWRRALRIVHENEVLRTQDVVNEVSTLLGKNLSATDRLRVQGVLNKGKSSQGW